MNRKRSIGVLIILFAVGLWTPSFLSGQSVIKKIRVVVENSSLRSEPNMQSEVIDSPPLGAVFEMIEKTDVWYKVKLNPEKYKREHGYVHMMFVEEYQQTVEPKKEARESQIEKGSMDVHDEKEGGADKKEQGPEDQKAEISKQEVVENEIKSMVHEYINALEKDFLLLFYEKNTTQECFSQLSEDAEWMSRTYDRVHSCVSDISIQLKTGRDAEVSLSLIITGLPRTGGSRRLLFEGIYIWSLIKQKDQWKIAGTDSQPFK